MDYLHTLEAKPWPRKTSPNVVQDNVLQIQKFSEPQRDKLRKKKKKDTHIPLIMLKTRLKENI